MWERQSSSVLNNWLDADTYCRNLSLDGYSGWRLPSFVELSSIIHYGQSNPAVDPIVFPTTQVGDYWTSTKDYVNGGSGFVQVPRIFNFAFGEAHILDGSASALTRCVRGDSINFLVILSTFGYAMPEPGAQGFYLEVKNDTQGINRPLFDYSALFGSAGKLQVTIDLGDVTTLASNPYGPRLDETVTTLNHELMHRFGTYVRFKNPDGTFNTGLLGKDSAHWSYLLDCKGSLMYGSGWQDNGNGSFTATAVKSSFSPLDLYLMGMIDKSQVPPMLLIENGTIDKTKLPQPGVTIAGTAKTVTIDNIIAAEGARIPPAATSPKRFNVGFAVLTRPGVPVGNALLAIETLRSAWAGKFAELTRGIGGVNGVAPSLTMNIDSPADGVTVTGPSVQVTGTVINTTGAETGVTVNGIPATIIGSRFVVNNVSLQEGSNAIEIKATDANGLASTTTKSVTAEVGHYLRIIPNIDSGTGPLDVSFRLDSSFSISNLSVNIAGPVAVETLPGATLAEFTAKFTVEGVYTITVSAVGPDGQTYNDSVVITVIPRSQLETLLQGKWEGMKTEISSIDVDGAIQYLALPFKEDFREAFIAAGASLPLLNNYLGPLELVYSADQRAKFRMERQEQVMGQQELVEYVVYFVKENGIWKLRKF